jgi:hypothetical protein
MCSDKDFWSRLEGESRHTLYTDRRLSLLATSAVVKRAEYRFEKGSESRASESPILGREVVAFSRTWCEGKHDRCYNYLSLLSTPKRGEEIEGYKRHAEWWFLNSKHSKNMKDWEIWFGACWC